MTDRRDPSSGETAHRPHHTAAPNAAGTSSNAEDGANNSLLTRSALVGSMTMLSRVLGLLRDVVIARFFGATDSADAFFVAFKVPQFLRRLFAEGAFAQAFVPVLSEYRQNRIKNGELAAVKSLINAVCGVLGITLMLLTGLVVWASPIVSVVFAPGFYNEPEKFALTVDLLRITFPYLFLISMTGFAGAILNSYDRFLVPAFTPVLLNLSLIGFAVGVSPLLDQPVFALAWGVLVAGCAQLLFQLPFLARLQLLPRPTINWHHPGVRKILRLMLPAIFGVSVSQINLLLDTVLASFLPRGSVSWLYYSDRLMELPLGVFGIAIATVILPSLSRLSAKSTQQLSLSEQSSASAEGAAADTVHAAHFRETVGWSLRCIVAIALPAMTALILLAEPILNLLFHYGATTSRDIAMASASLRAYSLGLLGFMAIKVLATAYYAQQDTKTPVKIGVIAMISNMVLNLIFVAIAHYYFAMGHVGLALATSCSAMLNAGLLLRGLRNRLPEHRMANRNAALDSPPLLDRLFWITLARVLLASVAMAIVLIVALTVVGDMASAGAIERMLQVIGLCVLGLLAYIAAGLICGARATHFRGHL